MANKQKYTIVVIAILILLLVGCGPSAADLAAVDYAPLEIDDGWEVSTPQEQGLDPDLVAELYLNAAELETVYSVLVIKNVYLVAEDYFNAGAVDTQYNIQSATKSYFSALVGLAVGQGCLTSVDQKMMDFFPEYADQITDTRKNEITIQHLLQMRSGYPWEESHPDLWEAFFEDGDWLPLIVHFPLTADPGTKYQYSNFSTYLLGVIVSRACETDFSEFAEQNLFAPIDTELGEMWQDNFGYYYINIHVTARDAACYGQLYLDDGQYNGDQIISADWVHASLQAYSAGEEVQYLPRIGPNFEQIGYGYQWWGVQSGEHTYDAALGHGGQMIAVLDDLDMVIVVTADPFWLEHNDRAWRYEKANLNLVADFIASLPSE